MHDDPQPLSVTRVIRSIASGAPLDWGAIESMNLDPSMLAMIRELHVVSQIADVHARPAALASGGDADPIPEDDGDRLASWGPLSVIEQVGSGTFGDVYRAWDPRLDREVALKVLRRHPAGGTGRAETVVEEGRLMARVRHPNVVAVYGADRIQGDAGIWMEFVEGRTLEELLAASGPFGVAETVAAGTELCRALDAVHRAGLLHGDVKAHNVMRAEGGRIVLMDFGAGCDLARHERAASLAGTGLYLAPEILQGNQATSAADVYSLGVLLYHLLTGAYPIEGTNLEEIRKAHSDHRTVPLDDRRPALPKHVTSAIERALSHDPDQRGGADDLRLALEGPVAAGLQPAHAQQVPPAAAELRTTPWRFGIGQAIATGAAVLVLFAILALARSAKGTRLAPGASNRPLQSIAVLPFENRFGDDYQFLADGIADEIGTQLARVKGVTVVSRRATARHAIELKQNLGDALHVQALLVGTIERSSDGLTVNVRVLDSRTREELAAKTYTGTLNDLGGTKGPAQEIGRSVRQRFWPRGPQDDGMDRPASAYLAYLRGRAALNRRTEASLREAVTRFEQAIAAEPAFAEAYAGLADARLLMGIFGFSARNDAWPKARAAATEALRLDDRLAEAHTSLAFGLELWEHRWADAEAAFKRAVELNPSYALAHHWYALLLDSSNRPEDALREIETAAALEPFSAPISSDIGMILSHHERYDAAIAQLERTVAVHGTYADAHKELGWAYALSGRIEEGIASLKRAQELGSLERDVLGAIGTIYARAGRRDDAVAIIRRLEQPGQGGPVPGGLTSPIWLQLGETDRGLNGLLRALPDGDVNILVGRTYDSVRTDPRYKELLRRTGFPAA